MLPHHTAGRSHFPPSSSPSSSSPASSVFRPKTQHHNNNNNPRYHPYANSNIMDKRRCYYSDDSASPSPPPTHTFSHHCHHHHPVPAPIRHDFFSALPQELIEEIGLFACSVPTPEDSVPDLHDDGDSNRHLFRADRHRQHALYTLSLISKLFHQIFHHRLYTHPLLIDTQLASSLHHLPHTATKWLTSSCSKAPLAKTFTLWRPRSQEMAIETPGPDGIFSLRPVNPFVIVYMFTNIRELTLSGNFRNVDHTPNFGGEARMNPPLMPEFVPNLTSVRLVDVDDAELLAVLLVGVAHKLTSLCIHPSDRGTTLGYSPRSVYNTLRPVIENLVSLASLSVSLPSVKFGLSRIDHCTHGCKLVHKSLVPLPAKEKLQHLAMDLPVFGCRTQFEKYDDPEEATIGGGKQVDHAWYYMTLQNFLGDCSNLQRLAYKGSHVPMEIVQRLTEACPSATMTFVKAEVSTSQQQQQRRPLLATSDIFDWMGPTGHLPFLDPPTSWDEPIAPPPPAPPAPAMWRPLTDPYPEPAEVDVQQFNLERYSTAYNFSHNIVAPPPPAMETREEETTTNILPPIYDYSIPGGQVFPKPYYHDHSDWQTSSPSDDADEEDEEPEQEEQEEYYEEEQHDGGEYLYQEEEDEEYLQEDATFNPHETMHINPQSQEWAWFVKYPDQ